MIKLMLSGLLKCESLTCDSLRAALLRPGGQEIVGDDDDVVGRRPRGGRRPLDDGDQVLGLLDQWRQQGDLQTQHVSM